MVADTVSFHHGDMLCVVALCVTVWEKVLIPCADKTNEWTYLFIGRYDERTVLLVACRTGQSFFIHVLQSPI